MGYKVFTEKEVRNAILAKAPYDNKSNGGHKIITIKYNNHFIDHLKVPNPHSKEFYQSKAKNVASKLKLTHDEYNEFVVCRMKKIEYCKILEKYLKKIEEKKNQDPQ